MQNLPPSKSINCCGWEVFITAPLSSNVTQRIYDSFHDEDGNKEKTDVSIHIQSVQFRAEAGMSSKSINSEEF